MWLMSGTEDASQHRQRSEVNSARVIRSLQQCGASLWCPLYVSRRKTHWTSWILHEAPAMTGWRGKQKGKISSKREREEGKEGWRRDKEGPVRPNKDRLYSSKGQMGVLFMVSPYTLRGAPLGPFKAEERCVCTHTVFPPGSHTHTWDNLQSPTIHTALLTMTNTPHKRSCACWICLCSVIFFYSLKPTYYPRSLVEQRHAWLFPHGS